MTPSCTHVHARGQGKQTSDHEWLQWLSEPQPPIKLRPRT